MGNLIILWWSRCLLEVLDVAIQLPGLYRYPLRLDLEILFFSIMPPKIRSRSDLEDLQNSFEDEQSSFAAAQPSCFWSPFFDLNRTNQKFKTPFGHGDEREKVVWHGGRRERQPWGMGNLYWIRVGRRVLFIDLLWSNSSSSQPITTLCEIRSKSDWLE